jgi:membrane protein DedA with SNARE-associated domain
MRAQACHPEFRARGVTIRAPGDNPGVTAASHPPDCGTDVLPLPEFPARRRRRPRIGNGFRTVGPLALPLLVLSVMQWVGTLASPALYERAPLLLAFLSPRAPFLLHASSHSPLVAFVVVAGVRSLLADPVNYCIGRRLGPGLYRRIEGRGGVACRVMRCSEWVIDRCGVVAVACRPNGVMLALAGSRRLNPVATGLAAVTGTLAYVSALALTAEAAASPLSRISSWIGSVPAGAWHHATGPSLPAVAAVLSVLSGAVVWWFRSRQQTPALAKLRQEA